MPQENVELARRLYEAWSRGDFTATGWADPEIQFVIATGPDPGRWKGLRAMREGWEGFLLAWDDYGAQAEEFRELDGDRVLALGRMVGRGKASGVKVEMEFTNVLDVRDGRVVALTLYTNRERAFADLGLAGPPSG